MNLLKNISLFLLIVIVCCKCKQEDDHDPEHDKRNAALVRQLNSSDTFISESSSDDDVKAWMRDEEKGYGLNSLNNGFDSIQIRVWYGCVLSQERLIILRLDSDKWKAQLCQTQYSGTYPDFSIARKVKNVKPRSGWGSLIAGLFNLKILTLPDLDKIDDFVEESTTDGCNVNIEIATKRFIGSMHTGTRIFMFVNIGKQKTLLI